MTAKPKLWETHSEGRHFTVWRYHNWYEPDVGVEMRFDHRRRQFTHVRRDINEEWQEFAEPVESHLMAKRRKKSLQLDRSY
jgi:hypothetical protein